MEMMAQYKIPLSCTPFDPDGLATVVQRYDSMPQMQMVDDFEKRLREFTGAKYVVALSSGTAAIHLALKAAGVGHGDEVLVSSFTYVATVNPILYLGAVPVFIDSELVTWNMDPDVLEEAIKDRMKMGVRPKAILVVHAYGMPAAMEEIMGISARYGIPVIEDAAEALGSEWNGRKLGTLGISGIYSFNNNKIITTYGGGAFVTSDRTMYERVLLWASQSRENKPFYEHREIGYNYRLGPLAAAAGLLAFERVDEKIERRRSVYDTYQMNLCKIKGTSFTEERRGSISNRWLTVMLLPESMENKVQIRLAEDGIETRPLWNPMSEQPVFQTFKSYSKGVANRLFRMGISLPSGDMLTSREQHMIISGISEAVGYTDG